MTIASDSSSSAASSAHRGLYPPWASVVRGDADAPTPAMPSLTPPIVPRLEPSDRPQLTHQAAVSSSDGTASCPVDAGLPPAAAPSTGEDGDAGISGNAAAAACGKKPAWVLPTLTLNTVIEPLAWPALSESTKAAPRSSSSESLKDKSVAITPPELAIPSPQSIIPTESLSSIYTTNRAGSSCQKPNNNSGGSSVCGEPASPASLEAPPAGFGWHPGQSHYDLPNKANVNSDRQQRGGGFTSQLHNGSAHHQSYGSNRRGSNSTNGARQHYGAHMNRQNHERGGSDWNAPQGYYPRDQHMHMPLHQHRANQQPFMQQPPPPPMAFYSAPPPPHFHPYGHMGYNDFPTVYYFPAPQPVEPMMNMPFVPQVPPAFPPVFMPSPNHSQNLLRQIEYYFSLTNLYTDYHLKTKMDNEGWVSISVIAKFPKVKELTSNMEPTSIIPYICNTLQISTIVEVKGDKIRSRDNWQKFIFPPANQNNNASLSPRIQRVSIGVQTSDEAGPSSRHE